MLRALAAVALCLTLSGGATVCEVGGVWCYEYGECVPCRRAPKPLVPGECYSYRNADGMWCEPK